jgi:hypothetical protein
LLIREIIGKLLRYLISWNNEFDGLVDLDWYLRLPWEKVKRKGAGAQIEKRKLFLN